MNIDPRIKIALGAIMAVVSYYLAVTRYAGDDIQSGVLFTIIGSFFAYRAVLQTRRFLAVERE